MAACQVVVFRDDPSDAVCEQTARRSLPTKRAAAAPSLGLALGTEMLTKDAVRQGQRPSARRNAMARHATDDDGKDA